MKKYKMLIATAVALVFIASPVFQGNALGTAAIEYDLQQNGLVFIQLGSSEEVLETVNIMRSELQNADAPTHVYVVKDVASFLRVFERNSARSIAIVGHGFYSGMSFGDTALETGDVLTWSALGNAINSRPSTAPVHVVACNSFNVLEYIENADNVIAPYAGTIGTKVAAQISSIGFFITKGQTENALAVAQTLNIEDFTNPEAILSSQPKTCISNSGTFNNVNLHVVNVVQSIFVWIIQEVILHKIIGAFSHVLAAWVFVLSTLVALGSLIINIVKLILWRLSSSVDLSGYQLCAGGEWHFKWYGLTYEVEISQKWFAYDDDGSPVVKKIEQYLSVDGIYYLGTVIPYHASAGFRLW